MGEVGLVVILPKFGGLVGFGIVGGEMGRGDCGGGGGEGGLGFGGVEEEALSDGKALCVMIMSA